MIDFLIEKIIKIINNINDFLYKDLYNSGRHPVVETCLILMFIISPFCFFMLYISISNDYYYPAYTYYLKTYKLYAADYNYTNKYSFFFVYPYLLCSDEYFSFIELFKFPYFEGLTYKQYQLKRMVIFSIKYFYVPTLLSILLYIVSYVGFIAYFVDDFIKFEKTLEPPYVPTEEDLAKAREREKIRIEQENLEKLKKEKELAEYNEEKIRIKKRFDDRVAKNEEDPNIKIFEYFVKEQEEIEKKKNEQNKSNK